MVTRAHQRLVLVQCDCGGLDLGAAVLQGCDELVAGVEDGGQSFSQLLGPVIHQGLLHNVEHVRFLRCDDLIYITCLRSRQHRLADVPVRPHR